jgi:hypothetical protein
MPHTGLLAPSKTITHDYGTSCGSLQKRRDTLGSGGARNCDDRSCRAGPIGRAGGKKDELVGLDSGLTVLDALSQLENKAFNLFEDAMLKIVQSSGGRVTFKTATHIAVELSKGMIAPIMAQIDPMHVGEVSRALKIGEEYGRRLSDISGNLQDGALQLLVHEYPSHGFVIDKQEAGRLFNYVRDHQKKTGHVYIGRIPPPLNNEHRSNPG